MVKKVSKKGGKKEFKKTEDTDTPITKDPPKKKSSKRTHDQVAEKPVDNLSRDSDADDHEEPTKKKPVGKKTWKYTGEASTVEIIPKDAIKYLTTWKNDRSTWTFSRDTQIWINNNKFSEDLIPDKIWPVVLEYFSSASSHVKKMIIEDSKKIRDEGNSDKKSIKRANDLIKHVTL